MAGTSTQRRETLVAVLLAAVVALSFVAGTVGLGAAHGKTDHITRNGDQLVVHLGDQHNATKAKQITVSVAGEKTLTWTSQKKENATNTFTVPVRKLTKEKTNLQDAKVTVTAPNGTTITERENLRMLSFAKGKQASFANDGTLRVPLKTALGYKANAGATVALDGKRKAVSGTVRYAGGSKHLAVSFDSANVSLPVSKQATIRVPGRATTTVPLQSLVRDATDVAPVDDETLAVSNPLLAPDTTHTVSIRTPSGRFASTVKTDGQGTLAVSNGALATAGKRTVSAYRGGNLVFEKQTSSSDSAKVYRGNVTEDGTRVKLLDGKSLDAPNATVWLTNGSDYARAFANVTNEGTVIDLGATNYRLHPNGSYEFILTGGTYARVEAIPGTRNASNSPFTLSKKAVNGSAGNESGGGPVSDFGFGGNRMVVLASLLALVGLVGGGLFVYSRRGGGSSSGSAHGATAGPAVETHKLTVSVDDGGTNGGLDATVTAEEMGTNGATESTRISDGRGTMTLERGVWYVTAESNGLSERKRVDVSDHSAVDFTLGPQQVTVAVTDDDGGPLSSVGVRCATDAGTSKTRKPGSDGRVTVNVPLDATEAELSADHEKFEGDETTVTFDDSASVESSLTLRRLTGGLRVSATVDGTPIPGARIEVTPREETVRELGEREHRARTDDDGTATFEGLLVGRYEIGMAIPSGGRAFRTTSKRVEVRDGATVSESLDASFQYSLDSRDRERIASLRERAESLSSASGRDVAIPRYYGTVVTDLLDAVERVPHQGHRFTTADEEPDAVVTALLDAAEETVRLIDDAMTTKRNTDLFGACVDVPDQRVEWTGEFDLDSLFELLDEDRTAQRQTVLEQLRRVDDRIDDERSGLAVVAPAREPWELTQEFVNSERGGDLVRGAAMVFVAGGLLDAVDELFDHEELRKRLERTVF